MLSVSEDYVRELNPDARLEVFGQRLYMNKPMLSVAQI